MIATVTFNGKNYRLINTDHVDPLKNAFTIIVGKNGTGKSRLLGQIALDFIQKFTSFEAANLVESNLSGEGYTTVSLNSNKLIAVSTSPFDKFPVSKYINQKKFEILQYSYLGIRELMQRNLGFAYLSKIMASLIKTISNRPDQRHEIKRILNYLGYEDSMEMVFESRISRSTLEQIIDSIAASKDPSNLTRILNLNTLSFGSYFHYNDDDMSLTSKLNTIVKVLKRIRKQPPQNLKEFRLRIDGEGIHTSINYPKFIDDFLFLIRCGTMRLKEVRLTKQLAETSVLISEASSGEQAIVLSILGIASQIEDGAVICIDEPEICLHPEWQERYIKLLTSTFATYSSCHFIIATHSPQIVSNLEPENSYILSLESGATTDAREFVRHSADFQLANVFNFPGFKNEYLSRIALNIFAKVSKNKAFDEEDRSSFELLIDQSAFLSADDPVFQLYNALKQMFQAYGRN